MFRIQLPSLNGRKKDIAEYARHFAEQFAAKMGKRIEKIDDAYIAALERHTWRGNVRELRNIVERSMIMAEGGTLTADTLPPEFQTGAGRNEAPDSMALDALERHHILKVLEYAAGNKAEAARLLGIGIATLLPQTRKLRPEVLTLPHKPIILKRPPYHFDRAAVVFGTRSRPTFHSLSTQ